MVKLDLAEVRLNGNRVLGPLRLEVERGEHVLVVGASGAGKTTLLRAIAGLQRLHAGRLFLFGALANDGARIRIAPNRRRVGFVFQGGALWPHMSVRSTLDFVLRCRGISRPDRARRAGEIIEIVELSGLEDRKPGALSGGEGQRLSLARALAMDPELLLLDEPLGSLDADLRGALTDRLADIQRRKSLTTLHVTHDPREVQRIATRTMRLASGLIVASPAEAPV
jgi:ABC-type sulfate/molybdate transport systems ATPase subunit